VKLLLAETWRHLIYGEPFFRRLRELGEETLSFREEIFFRPRQELQGALSKLSAISSHLQEKFRCGPRVDALNLALLDAVNRRRPDVVVLFRGAQIFPETLMEIQRKGVLVAGYNNDDPLSLQYPPYVWHHFVASIQSFDHLFAYRHRNLTDFRRLGSRSVSLLRSFYLRENNFPMPNVTKEVDVSFIGHWEDDGRAMYVKTILTQPEIRFRLWGTRWHLASNAGELCERFGAIQPLRGLSYNEAINRSKISLVFLSALNHDSYTRRCFEIPAAGGFMLAPHTEDLASMFREGVEAEYFRSPDEMIDKIRFYLRRENERMRIAQAGHERLLRDGHEALDRARQMRDEIHRLLGMAAR